MPRNQYFIGIDLHKSVIRICVVDGQGEVVHRERCRIESLQDGLEVVRRLGRWARGGRGLTARQLRYWQIVLGLPAGEVDAWLADSARSRKGGSTSPGEPPWRCISVTAVRSTSAGSPGSASRPPCAWRRS